MKIDDTLIPSRKLLHFYCKFPQLETKCKPLASANARCLFYHAYPLYNQHIHKSFPTKRYFKSSVMYAQCNVFILVFLFM